MAQFTIKEIADAVNGRILQGNPSAVIEQFSTNSKSGDEKTLFVPIIGERHDGHDFIADALKNGMKCTFTSRAKVEEDTEGMTYIQVKSTLEALQNLGAYYRNRVTAPIIGITGSVGKTTTKEMISAALETQLNVLKTQGNMNSQVGLPQMIMKIEEQHDIAVIEMGMSEFGEMSRIAAVARPEFAVITNIGVSHIGQLKTMENIRMEKANICNYFNEKSVLLVNGDDPLLRQIYDAYQDSTKTQEEKDRLKQQLHLSHETQCRLEQASIATFGFDTGCTVYADQIHSDGNNTYFTYHYQEDGEAKTEEIILSVLGRHNILNALCALYTASYYQIPPAVAKKGLQAYQPLMMRGSVEQTGGITIVDDTYNASPDSMKGAINVLLELPKKNRKIIVFADILELGEMSKQCHYEVGEYLAKSSIVKSKESPEYSIDYVLTIGKEAKYIADAVNDYSSKIKVKGFATKEEAYEYLKVMLEPGDTILLKGSRGMKLDVLAGQIKEQFGMEG